jgi:hypothetical protein
MKVAGKNGSGPDKGRWQKITAPVHPGFTKEKHHGK